MSIFDELNDAEEISVPMDLKSKLGEHAAKRAKKQRIAAAGLSAMLVVAFSSVAFAVAGGSDAKAANTAHRSEVETVESSTTVPDTESTVVTTPDEDEVSTTVGGTSVTTTPVTGKVYGKTYVDKNGDGLIDGRDGCDRNKDGVITDADNFDDSVPGKSEFFRNDSNSNRGSDDNDNNRGDDDDRSGRSGSDDGSRGGHGGRGR